MTHLLSKVFWVLAAPGNLLVLLLAFGTLRIAVSGRRHGFGLVATATAGLLAMIVLPVGDWLLIPLENGVPFPAALPGRIDGIVVLGGATDERVSEARAQIELNQAGNRLTYAALLARRHPEARVVLAGGNGNLFSDGVAEATVMRDFLAEHGIDNARMTLDVRSRNTFENAVFAYAAARPQPDETWVLVTSAAHMPRALGCFRRVGWAVIPYPVDYRTTGRLSLVSELSLSEELALVNGAVREWLALVVYRVLGRTDALFLAAA